MASFRPVWGEEGRNSRGSPRSTACAGWRSLGVLLFHGEISGRRRVPRRHHLLHPLRLPDHVAPARRAGRRSGRISLGRFWGRRARRILPAALLALARRSRSRPHRRRRAPGRPPPRRRDQRARPRSRTGGSSSATSPTPRSSRRRRRSQHFWSLAIEEQFYLVFPLIVTVLLFAATRVAARARGRRHHARCRSRPVLAALLYSPGHDPSRVYYGTDTRAVELLDRRAARHRARRPCNGSRRGPSGSPSRPSGRSRSIALVRGVGHRRAERRLPLPRRPRRARAARRRGHHRGARPGPVRTALASPPLRALGLISYGVYLYHWPIFLWLTPGAHRARRRRPLRRAHRARRSRWRPSRTSGSSSRSGTGVGSRAGARRRRARPPSPRSRCCSSRVPSSSSRAEDRVQRGAEARRPSLADVSRRAGRGVAVTLRSTPGPAATVSATARTGTPRRPAASASTRAAASSLVGDSVAQTLGRGLERWGPPHGVDVVNGARFYCGIAGGGRSRCAARQHHDTCGTGPARWPAMLDRIRPDVVVVLTTIWDIGRRQRDEWGPDFLGCGRSALRPVRRRRVATRRGSHSGLAGRGSSGSRRRARPRRRSTADSSRTPTTTTCRAADRARARRARSTSTRSVCPDGKFSDQLGPVADGRPDGLHFSDRGRGLGRRWLGPRLVDPACAATSARARPPT